MTERGSKAARTVLLLHSSAGRYGADLLLLGLASGLDHSRFNPLAVLPERGELADLLEAAGVEVVTAPLAVLRRSDLGPRGAAALARGLRAADGVLEPLARERRVALIHSNTSVILTGHRLARRLAIPHLLHVRELYPRPPLAWPLMRRALLRADRLVCMSGAIAAQFEASAKAVVVHDGLTRVPRPQSREAARAELGLDPHVFTVLLIGRISAWKGQDVLARALARPELAEVGAVGLVAGDPWPGAARPLRELERLRDALGLGQRLRLLGYRSDLDRLLGAADAVAVPSTRPEPFGLVALEGAAAGLPVVAAAHGGLPEILDDGRTGILVPPGDAQALAAALRRLAHDPDAARRLGAAAATDVASRFRADRMLAQVQGEYEALLHSAAG